MSSTRGNFFRHQMKFEDIVENRIRKGLTLRKLKIEEMISDKRFQREQEFDIEMVANKETGTNKENFNILKDFLSEYHESIRKEPYNEDCFQNYCRNIFSDDVKLQIQGLVGLRKCLSHPNEPPECDFISTGIVQKLIELISNRLRSNNTLDFEIIWIFVNLVSIDEKYSHFLLNNGIVEVLENIICTADSSYIIDQLIWLLANLAPDDAQRKLVANFKFTDFLLKVLLNSNFQKLMPNTFWAITNMIRRMETIPMNKSTLTLLNFCCHVIRKYFEMKRDPNPVKNPTYTPSIIRKLLPHSVMNICSLTDKNTEMITKLTEMQITDLLIDLLDEESENDNYKKMFISNLRLIGNLSAADNQTTSDIVDNGIMPKLIEIISIDSRPGVRKECCFILSNIAAGLQQHISIFFQQGYIEPLLTAAREDKKDVRKEALWCLANLTSTNRSDYLVCLINHGILSLLGEWVINSDYRISAICLEALDNILSYCVAAKNPFLSNRVSIECEKFRLNTKVDALTECSNLILSEKSKKLLDNYFNKTQTDDIIVEDTIGQDSSDFEPVAFGLGMVDNNETESTSIFNCSDSGIVVKSNTRTASPPKSIDEMGVMDGIEDYQNFI